MVYAKHHLEVAIDMMIGTRLFVGTSYFIDMTLPWVNKKQFSVKRFANSAESP